MPDLTVSMFDSPDAVPLGSPITYIATVTNRGDAGSIPTNLVNPLPIGSMVEDIGPGCDVVGNAITCLVPGLAPGASIAFTFSLHAAGPIGGMMVNTATVDPSNVVRERDEANNGATTSTIIFAGPIAPPLPPQALPDLSVAVAAPRDPVQLGTAFSYKLTVTNDGGMPSAPTTLISNIPANTALRSTVAGCQVTDVTVSCAVPSLPPGATMGFDVTLDAIAAGPISNTATVDPGNIVAEGDEANNSAAIVASVVAPAPAPVPAPAAPPAQPAPPPAQLPSGDMWLRILLPTEAFSVDMDPLWTATPGE